MSYHFLNVRLEDTIKNYIESQGAPPCNIYTFGEMVALGDKIAEPFAGIRCSKSSPMDSELQLGEGMGNRMYQVEIAVRSHAEDVTENANSTVVLKTSRQQHADLVGQILDLFYRSDIQTVLNDAAAPVGNIGIYQVDHPEIVTDMSDRSYVTLITFPIGAYPKE